MRHYLTILLVICGLLISHAQSFQESFEIALPDSLTYHDLQWADLNGDTLLDVIVHAKTAQQTSSFLIFTTDRTQGPLYNTAIHTAFLHSTYLLTDFNVDGRIDVLLSGMEEDVWRTVVWQNQGNLAFAMESVADASGTLLKFADLDQDGSSELMISGGEEPESGYLFILKGAGSQWTGFDTLNVHARSIEVRDFNKDNFPDMFISGVTREGKRESRFYFSEKSFVYTEMLVADIAGTSSVSDLNHDGYLDIVVSGENQYGEIETRIIFSSDQVCSDCFEQQEGVSLQNTSIFSGDLNSDGRADVSLLGQTAATADTLNLIWQPHVDNYDTIDFPNTAIQAFGDIDRDGDLDIIQLYADGLKLRLIENTAPDVNGGPTAPTLTLVAKIFDRFFIEWTSATDDRTPSGSITYDVLIAQGEDELLSPAFNRENRKRMLVTHGNAGTNKSLLLESDANPDFVTIQSVDNAYHTSKGVCVGEPGESCSDFATHRKTACLNETLQLTAPRGDGIWLSFSNGVLANMGNSIEYTMTQPDTVIVVSRTLSPGGCSQIDAFILEFRDSSWVVNNPCVYACEGTELTFEAERQWEQLLWSSKVKGPIGSEVSITYEVTEADTLTLHQEDGVGCVVEEVTPINISLPALVLENETYQILRGDEVQLEVSGGESYAWTPAETLNSINIATPIATPWETTTYTVTALDSLGCTASATVLVIVEENAFIPSLFTPNDDDKNDELRLFGVDEISNFRFTVYNREGSQVFSTTSADQMLTQGWDGTSKGVKQPAGVYYWKVEGNNIAGKNLLLNGKNVGSVVLIR